MKKGSIASLTGIRGVAALWVLLYHLQSMAHSILPGILDHEIYFLKMGWIGVDLFFILSGFILAHAHRDMFSSLRRNDLLFFARSRFLRVYPLSFLVLLAVCTLVFWDAGFAAWYRQRGQDNLSAWSFVKTALLATRWGLPGRGEWNEPAWSLSVEILGYAIFPWAVFYAARIRRFGVAVALIALCFLLIIAPATKMGVLGENMINIKWSIARMVCFFGSGVLARQAVDLAPSGLITLSPWLALASVIALPVMASFPAGPAAAPIGFLVLVSSLYFQNGIVDRILSSKGAAFLGEISFPLYLIHLMPILWFDYHIAQSGTISPIIFAALSVALAGLLVIAAWLLHKTVEVPLARLARRHPPLSGHMPEQRLATPGESMVLRADQPTASSL